MGQMESAKQCAWELIDRNCESGFYFDILCRAHGANDHSDTDNEIRKSVFESIINKYPRSKLAKRLMLGLCSGI